MQGLAVAEQGGTAGAPWAPGAGAAIAAYIRHPLLVPKPRQARGTDPSLQQSLRVTVLPLFLGTASSNLPTQPLHPHRGWGRLPRLKRIYTLNPDTSWGQTAGFKLAGRFPNSSSKVYPQQGTVPTTLPAKPSPQPQWGTHSGATAMPGAWQTPTAQGAYQPPHCGCSWGDLPRPLGLRKIPP